MTHPTLPRALGASLLLAGAALVMTSAPASSARTYAVAPEAVSFAGDVLPIFKASCVSCHGGMYDGQQRVEASLDLRTWESVIAGSEYGTVVEPGDPEGSLLLEMIVMGDMPEEGDPLTPEQIDLIRTWIAEGAENN